MNRTARLSLTMIAATSLVMGVSSAAGAAPDPGPRDDAALAAAHTGADHEGEPAPLAGLPTDRPVALPPHEAGVRGREEDATID